MIKSIKIPKPWVVRPVTYCRCLRCGHEWLPLEGFKFSSRGNLIFGPKRCARDGCRSPRWMVPYIRKQYRGKVLPIAFGMPSLEATQEQEKEGRDGQA